MPEVSVIVPNYNHAGFLRQRLDSIFDQDFSDFEVILLDDRSSDNSTEILDRYASDPRVVRYEKNDTNSGSPFKQWIKGFSYCKGRYVWVAESDDYSDPKFLGKCLETFRKDPAVKLVYTASIGVTAKGERDNFFKNWISEISESRWRDNYIRPGGDEIRYSLSIRNTIGNTSSVVMDRNLVAPLIAQIADFRYSGDWYLWIAVLSTPGVKIGFVAEPLNYFRAAHYESTRDRRRLGFPQADEQFRCIRSARLQIGDRSYSPIALGDLRLKLYVMPLRSFFKKDALVGMSKWLFKDPFLPGFVIATIFKRAIIWLRIKAGMRQ